MANNQSSRHHYLPVFYLKEFANSKGKLFVYDKIADKILSREMPPKSVFFDWDRNSFELGNKKYSLLEDTYQKLDSGYAESFKDILKFDYSSVSDRDHIRISLDLLLFVNFIRWRVPARDEIVQSTYDRYEIGDLSMKLIDKDTGVSISDIEILNKIKSIPIFKKFQGAAIIHEPFYNYKHLKSVAENLEFHAQDKIDLLICDNPYIESELSKDVKRFSEFFMPITKNKYVFYLKNKSKLKIDEKFGYLFQLSKFESALKYVACSELHILEFYVNEFRKYKTQSIIKEFFEYCNQT